MTAPDPESDADTLFAVVVRSRTERTPVHRRHTPLPAAYRAGERMRGINPIVPIRSSSGVSCLDISARLHAWGIDWREPQVRAAVNVCVARGVFFKGQRGIYAPIAAAQTQPQEQTA